MRAVETYDNDDDILKHTWKNLINMTCNEIGCIELVNRVICRVRENIDEKWETKEETGLGLPYIIWL